MKLYNTLTRSIEGFEPLHKPKVTFYSCGPTVYDYTHIGHARKYIHDDLLTRALTFFGYDVHHVMNITDVGHLESDADDGEDKLEKGAAKYNKTPEQLSQQFTDYFKTSMKAFNVQAPDNYAIATEHIQDMIELIQIIEQKGATYETDSALYFDTSTFKNYGRLSGQNIEDKKQQARDDVYADPEKKNAADFVLWFKRVGRHSQHIQHWESPWGDGFPGWHIECSAMSMKYLGHTIDIHSGGIDHIPVHHENEIAQSECATGEQFVRFWFHSEFLMIDGTKMSKSLGNLFTLDDIQDKNIDPIALRYLFLQAHYRQELNFTWESLQAAEKALNKLRKAVIQLRSQTQRNTLSEEKLSTTEDYAKRFAHYVGNDLQMPQALALVWEVIKSNIPSEDKLDLIYSFDLIFGLDFASYEEPVNEIPSHVYEKIQERDAAREKNDYATSDAIRAELEEMGYDVSDTTTGTAVKKR